MTLTHLLRISLDLGHGNIDVLATRGGTKKQEIIVSLARRSIGMAAGDVRQWAVHVEC